MNIGERLSHFERKGFPQNTAAVIVLIEEALSVLFRNFRDTFVLFGGATLVLFYDSKRHSGDLDLLSLLKQPPSPEKLIQALKDPLTEVAEVLHLAPIQIEILQNSGDVNKLAVLRTTREVLFTIDITKMSAVIQSELVHEPIPDEETVVTHPSRNLLLLHKAEAFLTRKKVKARDAFDIKLLSDSGGKLDDNLRIHLIDGPASDRLEDPEYIRERIRYP